MEEKNLEDVGHVLSSLIHRPSDVFSAHEKIG